MMSSVDPYPFTDGMDQLKSKDMDQLNKRVWIDSRHHWRSTLYVQNHYCEHVLFGGKSQDSDLAHILEEENTFWD